MIVIVCIPCQLAVRVLPDVAQTGELETLVGRQSDFWPDKFPCPRCEKHAKGVLESEVNPAMLELLELHDLTPQEAFQLFMGMGFPEEQNCTLEVLSELLRAQPVRRVHGADVRGERRAIVESLELWDGTKIYLGAAPGGAVVYRIARPPNAVARLERGA